MKSRAYSTAIALCVLLGLALTALPVSKRVSAQATKTSPDFVTLSIDGSELGEVTVRQRRGKFTEYQIPTPGSFPQDITVGPNGALWFTQARGSKIGRINNPQVGTRIKVDEYKIPTPRSFPQGITAGPDGAVWFAERDAGKIGRLDPASGQVKEYSTPTANSSPIMIIVGPDRALWFSEGTANKIARLDPATGAVKEYPTPTNPSGPGSITTGPDGALWFTEIDGNRIGRISTSGEIKEYPVPAPRAGTTNGPGIIIAGTDGALYFTEMYGNQIGRIDPNSGQITEFPSPTAVAVTRRRGERPSLRDDARPENMKSSGPASITVGPDGTIWYTEMFAGKIGQLVIQ
jgi:virginiamycin B lyase